MQVTPDELRQRFAAMTDEELASVNREELVDLARSIYDAEIARRHLDLSAQTSGEETEAEAEPDPVSWNESNVPEELLQLRGIKNAQDLVKVADYLWAEEAQLAESLLRSQSIPCVLFDEHTVQINWLLSNLLKGVKLMVPSAYADQARAILAAPVSQEEVEKEAGESIGPTPDR